LLQRLNKKLLEEAKLQSEEKARQSKERMPKGKQEEIQPDIESLVAICLLD
jgi:hypothetical protein